MTRLKKFMGLAAMSAVGLTISGCNIGGQNQNDEVSQVESGMALPDIPIDSARGDTVTVKLPVEQGLIYVVDIESSKNSMGIGFSDSYRTSYSGNDFTAHQSDFESAMTAAFNGGISMPTGWSKSLRSKRCRTKIGNVNGDPKLQKCPEPDADLSISNSRVSFIAFVLKKKLKTGAPNGKITWRFVEEDPNTPDQYQDDHIIKRHVSAGDYYSYLRKMDKDGKFQDAVCLDSGCKKDDFKQSNVVGGYFVANGTAAVGGDDTPTSTAVYRDRFNLYTEIHSTDDTGTNIPVIIDPDVRWPGGDGP